LATWSNGQYQIGKYFPERDAPRQNETNRYYSADTKLRVRAKQTKDKKAAARQVYDVTVQA
jgi:hypothetical protein